MEPKYYFISYRFCNPGAHPIEWMPNWTVTDKHPVELFQLWEVDSRVYLKQPVDYREISAEDYARFKPMRPDPMYPVEYFRPVSRPPANDERVLLLVRSKDDKEVYMTGGHYHGNAEGNGWLVDTWRESDTGHEVLGWLEVPKVMLRVNQKA